MNRGWRPRELVRAIREDLGVALTKACHDAHAKAINWCSEFGIGTSHLEIIKLDGKAAEYYNDFYRAERGYIFSDTHLFSLMTAPLLFYRGLWAPNLNELIVDVHDPVLTARLYFDSIDEAKEFGFQGRGVLLATGTVLDLNEEDSLEVVGLTTPY